MRRHHMIAVILVCTAALGIGAMVSRPVEAQSGTRVERGRVIAEQPFESRFWNYLRQVDYKNWAPGPEQNGDFYAGQSPHGAFLKMYLNRTAIADPENLRHGSILIKENYGPDKKTLMAITVMYRAKGFDANSNDWYWVKYNPDGRVATAPPEKGGMKLAGSVNGCIQCHRDAGGNDFAFIND